MLWACLAAAALLPVATAQADAMPHADVGRRVPRACDVDDARCLALQRDVCDPWNVTADQYVPPTPPSPPKPTPRRRQR